MDHGYLYFILIFMDIYFIFRVIIQYDSILLLKLFHVYHWGLFHLAFVSLRHPVTILAFVCLLIY